MVTTSASKAWGWRAAVTAFLVVMALACARPVHAQAGDYSALIREALVEYNSANLGEARLLFERAHAIRPSARTFRGMGLCSFELRSYVAAVRDLEAALASHDSPLSAEQRPSTERALARAREYVAVYALQAPAGVSTLMVDGQRTALPADGRLSLDPGKHVLSVKTESGPTIEREIVATAGARQELVFEAGTRATTAGAPSDPTKPAPSDAPSEGGRVWTWVAAGATVVFGIGSASFGLLGKSENSEFLKLRDVCPGPACREQDKDAAKSRGQTYQLFTNVGLGLTGAAAAATIALYFIEGGEEREAQVTASVGPGFVGVRGAF